MLTLHLPLQYVHAAPSVCAPQPHREKGSALCLWKEPCGNHWPPVLAGGLQICLCKTLTEYLFTSGIRESIEPLLHERGGSKELLESFIKGLSGLHYTAGSRFFLTFLHPGKLIISSVSAHAMPANLQPPESMETVVVESPLLCNVVKDAYLAHHCVSQSLRQSMADGAKLLLG